MIRNPTIAVTNGYDIHVTFVKKQRKKAHLLSAQFIEFLQEKSIPYSKHKIFDAPVGPWGTPMWQVILPQSRRMHQDLGECIAWLMLNRGNLSVMIHPNTQREGGLGGGYEDHSQNMLWMGEATALRLNIFKKESTSNVD